MCRWRDINHGRVRRRLCNWCRRWTRDDLWDRFNDWSRFDELNGFNSLDRTKDRFRCHNTGAVMSHMRRDRMCRDFNWLNNFDRSRFNDLSLNRCR